MDSLDGRHQRSARSREAVVEAMLDLLRESGTQPSAQAVAERAEVSLRTVFRLFEDVDTMFAAAVTSQVQRVGAMFEPLTATEDLETRIDELVRHRAQLFEEIAPIRRVALHRDDHATIRDWLGRSHELLRRQTGNQFAAELALRTPRQRKVVVEALDAATGWPMWDALRREQALDVDTAVTVIAHTVGCLLRSSSEGTRPMGTVEPITGNATGVP